MTISLNLVDVTCHDHLIEIQSPIQLLKCLTTIEVLQTLVCSSVIGYGTSCLHDVGILYPLQPSALLFSISMINHPNKHVHEQACYVMSKLQTEPTDVFPVNTHKEGGTFFVRF